MWREGGLHEGQTLSSWVAAHRLFPCPVFPGGFVLEMQEARERERGTRL